MKGKLLGEVAVQFDRLQQQQRRAVPGSPAPHPQGSSLPTDPTFPGCSVQGRGGGPGSTGQRRSISPDIAGIKEPGSRRR